MKIFDRFVNSNRKMGSRDTDGMQNGHTPSNGIATTDHSLPNGIMLPPAGNENKVTVVLGAQWGDEGKGKLVDMLATDADVVCRCQVSLIFVICEVRCIHVICIGTSFLSKHQGCIVGGMKKQ